MSSPEVVHRRDPSDPPDPSETRPRHLADPSASPLRPFSPLGPLGSPDCLEEEPDPREPLPLDEEGYETTYGMRQLYCVWTYSDGARCRGIARKGTRLCYWHDPETEEERQTGFIKTRPVQQPKPITTEAGPLASEEDIDSLIKEVARYLARDDQPDVGRAHALTNVAKHLLKSFELDQLRDELTQAQTQLRRLKNRRKPRKKHLRKALESVPLASSVLPLPSITGTILSKGDSNE